MSDLFLPLMALGVPFLLGLAAGRGLKPQSCCERCGLECQLGRGLLSHIEAVHLKIACIGAPEHGSGISAFEVTESRMVTIGIRPPVKVTVTGEAV